jgi:hypothetical protein
LEWPPLQDRGGGGRRQHKPSSLGWVRPAPSKGSRGKDADTNAGGGSQSRRGCRHRLGGTSCRLSRQAGGRRGHGAARGASRAANRRRRNWRHRQSSGTKQGKGGMAELRVEVGIPTASEVEKAGSGQTSRVAEAGQGGGGALSLGVSMVVVPGRAGDEGRERPEESPDLPAAEAEVAGVGRSSRRPPCTQPGRNTVARANLPCRSRCDE